VTLVKHRGLSAGAACGLCSVKRPRQGCDYRNTRQKGKARNAALGVETRRIFCQFKAASVCH